MSDATIKDYNAEICRLCEKLYPTEWRGKYTGPQNDFRIWLNAKTGLNVDHRDFDLREAALKAWRDALLVLESLL